MTKNTRGRKSTLESPCPHNPNLAPNPNPNPISNSNRNPGIYSGNNVNRANVHKVNVQVNGNKVNVKANVNTVNNTVNDIYSIHSHYKGGAACGRATTKELPRPWAAAPLLWFPLSWL